ncbi:MAG: SixA phosphatase family protein [Acidimicrobiales bacterium]
MAIYFVRHAHAGSRGPGHHDRYRPLSERGTARATELVDLLADAPFTQVVSSPATRCVQTVEPLALARGLDVIEDERLWEDGFAEDVMGLLGDLAKVGAVLCSHGNIIPEVVDLAARGGAKVKGRGCEKGSVWILEFKGSKIKKATYQSKRAISLA